MGGRRPSSGPTRRARRTVRIICEGEAEICLVRYVRQLYTSAGQGHAVSHRNARGKGGRRALELALSPRVRDGVDVIAIFIDTDQDWDTALRRRANDRGVAVLESEPCLEAWLLQVAGRAAGSDSAACKRAFRTAFGAEAHEPDVYNRYFDRSVLDGARRRVPVLDQLLGLMGV
jgi:hypothetical protein